MTAAATQLLKTESSIGSAAAAAAAAPEAPEQQPQQQQVTLAPPGSLEGWHVAGCGEGAAGAAEWWGRPAEQWSADERLLAAGARVVAGLREAVERRLGFTCSAGERSIAYHVGSSQTSA